MSTLTRQAARQIHTIRRSHNEFFYGQKRRSISVAVGKAARKQERVAHELCWWPAMWLLYPAISEEAFLPRIPQGSPAHLFNRYPPLGYGATSLRWRGLLISEYSPRRRKEVGRQEHRLSRSAKHAGSTPAGDNGEGRPSVLNLLTGRKAHMQA